jgi:UDP-3-O-[3-hydroxymyristoyl] glucosamine N-acyltransferase
MITAKIFEEIGKISVTHNKDFNGIGSLSTTSIPNMLSWLFDEKYLNEVESNLNITGLITTEAIAEKIQRSDICLIIHSDPFAIANLLIDYQTHKLYKKTPNDIHPTAQIHAKAYIADYNVVIGAHTIVEAQASVLPDSIIGQRCVIRTGAIISSDNFNKFRTLSGTVVGPFSDRKVIIGDDVEVGNNTCIDKGDSETDTIIGDRTKLHNQIQICHGTQIGNDCLFWGGVFVCGFASIADQVQIQPRATISNYVRIGKSAYIGINSLVTHDLEEGKSFLGTRALGDRAMLDKLKEKFAK